MFLILVTYIKPLEKVDNLMEDHMTFLNKYYEQKKFICSGRRNPRVGGVILANVNTSKEIEDIIQEDPFYSNKIAEYEVIEFSPTKFDEKFKVFVEDGEQA